MAPPAACGDERALLAVEAAAGAGDAPAAAGARAAAPAPAARTALRAAAALAATAGLLGAAALAAAAAGPGGGPGAGAGAGAARASRLYWAGGYGGGTAVVVGAATTATVPAVAVHSFQTAPQTDPIAFPGQGDLYHGGGAPVQPPVQHVLVVRTHARCWFGWPCWGWGLIASAAALWSCTMLYFCCAHPRSPPLA